jgi:hypothetical protein
MLPGTVPGTCTLRTSSCFIINNKCWQIGEHSTLCSLFFNQVHVSILRDRMWNDFDTDVESEDTFLVVKSNLEQLNHLTSRL